MGRDVAVIGVPYGQGGVGEGCELGPDAVRLAGLREHVFPEATADHRYVGGYEDGGDLAVASRSDLGGGADVETLDDASLSFDPDRYDLDDFVDGLSESAIVDAEDGCAKHLDEIARLWDVVADAVAERVDAGGLPLVVGGDHTVATGTMRGASRDGEIGVLWLDAHGDYNTPLTSPSGNVHGMPLAAALGRGPFGGRAWAEANVREGSVALVGLRTLDHDLPDWVADHDEVDDASVVPEAEAIADSEMTALTMADVDERGIDAVVREAIDVARRNVDGVHVSVDLDWLDASEVSGVGTPVANGATRREARRAMEILAEENRTHDFVRSIEFVEVNPLLDETGNGTAEVAAELAGATFGARFVYE